MGFRLPLDALPYVPDAKLDAHPERDPFEPVQPLGPDSYDAKATRSPAATAASRRADQPRQAFQEQGQRPGCRPPGATAAQPQSEDHRQPLAEQATLPDDYPAELVRTALCIEAREGRLYCFMPPLTHLEHWLDLVSCLEDTAAETGLKIIVEGYEPPRTTGCRSSP
jgi:uncharacterized protein (DUF2126 family)